MGTTTDLRRELKKRFMPFMADRGFTLDQRQAPQFYDFRRTVAERIQFLELQWEKSGRPRFVVNYGSTGIRGTICHNQPVRPEDVSSGQAERYCRLHPNGNGSSTRHWFRQDRPLFAALFARHRLYPPDRPVQQLIELFDEIETYWTSGMIGENSREIVNPWVKDVI